jgi:hypothetical protein
VKLANISLGQCYDLDISEAHPLEHSGDILLVAADPIQRLRINELEVTPRGILHECLDAFAHERGARDRAVRIDLGELTCPRGAGDG